MGNLLGNAIKYSGSEQPIEVELRVAGPEIEVRVLDRGIGFDPEEADELFTNFYRSPAAMTRGSGLGIGLSACRRLVTLLGGRIWAQPRDDGGSEFGFALKAAPALLD